MSQEPSAPAHQRALTEALTAAVMAMAAYRRWLALGDEGALQADEALLLIHGEADRMGAAAGQLLGRGAGPVSSR